MKRLLEVLRPQPFKQHKHICHCGKHHTCTAIYCIVGTTAPCERCSYLDKLALVQEICHVCHPQA